MDATRTDADPTGQALPDDISRREAVVRLGARGLAAHLPEIAWVRDVRPSCRSVG